MKNKIKEIISKLNGTDGLRRVLDDQKLLFGAVLTKQLHQRGVLDSLCEAEFRVFSQWADDGIIQYLVRHLEIPHQTFIEFGVEDYSESNTRFLMMQDNWSGLILDGSSENIEKIRASYYYWQHDLEAMNCFVDRENINRVISSRGFDRNVGLLHVDIDGNDYWIWDSIDVIHPIIVIIEYNSVFGSDRAITVPYRKDFERTKAHHSNLYFGASLAALVDLSRRKGYQFIGCNKAGNNAYFVRKDKLNDSVIGVSVNEGFRESKFRESRDSNGQLTFQGGTDRLKAIKSLPVVNIKTGQNELL